jgi:aspartate aminotransferase-like enzyme
MQISDFVKKQNTKKNIFTPGPATLLAENLSGLRPCFGRGDQDYERVENKVLGFLKDLSGHQFVVPLQGSASLALEIMIRNFVKGHVLLVSSGYYSDRILELFHDGSNYIDSIEHVGWEDLEELNGEYDWVISCSTETSIGLKLPINWLSTQAKRLHAKLMLDATASIGLESNHDLADVIAYSSCKGLFGLTGAGFVAFNELPSNKVNSFYMDLYSHIEKRMTGPYHAIASLLDVLPMHSEFREAVVINKNLFCEKMKDYLIYDEIHQPLLCTFTSEELIPANNNVILYQSRADIKGQVVAHLGEVYLGLSAKGKILKNLCRKNNEQGQK